MKSYTQKIIRLILCVILFTACKNNDTETFTSNTVIVATDNICLAVNMGNYSESNGSLSLMKSGQSIAQNIYTAANGYPLRSIVESAAFYGDVALLMCGNEDKVEFVNKRNGKVVASAVTGIGLPRYATFIGKQAYVTCVNPTWRDSVGYVSIIDMETYKLTKQIRIKGNPEGICSVGNQLYVATGNGIARIDIGNDSVNYIVLPNDSVATARYFVRDANGDLWLSFTHYDNYGNGKNCGIAKYKPGESCFDDVITLDKMNGDAYIDLSPDGKTLYYMYASEVVGGQSPEAVTCIYSVDLASKEVHTTPLCSGHGFYGFNVDPSTGNIYTANVNGFITNSMISIFSASGTLLQDDLMAGVGTCRFYFFQ